MFALLERHIYYERDIESESHFIHVETDDDEVNIEYFFFDDDFLQSPYALDRLPDPRAMHYERDEETEEEEEDEDDDDDEEMDAYATFIHQLTEE